MATTKRDLAKGYASRIKSAPHKHVEANVVINEINGLVYSISNQTLSQSDKEEIISLIAAIFDDEGLTYKSADNTNYLQLINYMLTQIKVVKK